MLLYLVVVGVITAPTCILFLLDKNDGGRFTASQVFDAVTEGLLVGVTWPIWGAFVVVLALAAAVSATAAWILNVVFRRTNETE